MTLELLRDSRRIPQKSPTAMMSHGGVFEVSTGRLNGRITILANNNNNIGDRYETTTAVNAAPEMTAFTIIFEALSRTIPKTSARNRGVLPTETE